MLARYGWVALLAGLASHSLSAADVADPSVAAKPGFFTKLGDSVKKGVTDGTSNGVQVAGRVKVLGYVMAYSKLQGRDMPGYCLANADTDKLITVAPMFGSPYQRSDGSSGFTPMAVPADKNHDRVEVNLQGVLPGQNCVDLLSQHKLEAYSEVGPGGGGAVAGSKEAPSGQPLVMGCLTKPVEKVEKDQIDAAIKKGLIPDAPYWICVNRRSGREMSLLSITEHKIYPLPPGFTNAEGVRADGSVALPANVQAGWDKVDRDQREGFAKVEADSAARDSANADKALLRKAAFEKCKPLIKTDNAKMEAFKACVAEATK